MTWSRKKFVDLRRKILSDRLAGHLGESFRRYPAVDKGRGDYPCDLRRARVGYPEFAVPIMKLLYLWTGSPHRISICSLVNTRAS